MLRAPDDLLDSFGRCFEDWPLDLELYSQVNGLLIWEGTIDRDSDEWRGVFRLPTPAERRMIAEDQFS